MSDHITLLDGAQGTLLWDRAAARGIEKKSVWTYNLEHPEVVEEVCRAYKDAGSEIICANTFGINRLTAEREGHASVKEVVEAAVGIAKKVLEGTDVRVALDIGPLPALTEPYGDLEEDETEEIFDKIVQAGADAGADCIFLETFIQLEMLAAAARAAKKSGLPVFCSMSFEAAGRTIFGVSVDDMLEELEPLGLTAIGMNCSIGPDQALPIIQEFAEKTDLPLFFKPNAGMPTADSDGNTTYSVKPEEFAEQAEKALETGRIGYLGGCCGTDPDFIRKLQEIIKA